MAATLQVVGDHAQAAVMHQRARDGLGGGADVEHQRTVVRAPAAATARAMRALPSALSAWRWRWAMFSMVELGAPHAAVEARQQAGVRQPLDVAPHRLQGHAELVGQFFDGRGPALRTSSQQLRSGGD